MGNNQAHNQSTCTSDSFASLKVKVNEANKKTAKLLDEDSCHLQFILYPDTEGEILLPLFWKHTVRVEAYLVKAKSLKRKNRITKTLNFKQFHNLYSFIEQIPLENSGAPSQLMKEDIHNGLFSRTEGEVEECMICMERAPDTVFPCAHAYCEPCAKQWCEKSEECPMCRATVKDDDSFFMMEVGDDKVKMKKLMESFSTYK